MKKKIVLALGGNALGLDPKEQKMKVQMTINKLAPILNKEYKVIITHGNGPQVGLINNAFLESSKYDNSSYPMDFPECNAMSEGYIGYHLCEAINNYSFNHQLNLNVVALITHIMVDENDSSFKNPTKPIGAFLSLEEIKKTNYPFINDANRGYRRVIASPKPLTIIEKEQIKTLMDNGYLVICCGGGGIPINKEYQGLDAVIDKDYASSLLATAIDADMLMIITSIDYVKIHFGQENEENLTNIKADELRKHLENNEFQDGSMKPKIEACLNFLNNKKDGIAIITSIDNLEDALTLKKGTIIKN